MFYISLLSPHSSLLFLILHYYLSSLNVVEFCVEYKYFTFLYQRPIPQTSANIQQQRTKKNYASVHYNAKTY